MFLFLIAVGSFFSGATATMLFAHSRFVRPPPHNRCATITPQQAATSPAPSSWTSSPEPWTACAAGPTARSSARTTLCLGASLRARRLFLRVLASPSPASFLCLVFVAPRSLCFSPCVRPAAALLDNLFTDATNNPPQTTSRNNPSSTKPARPKKRTPPPKKNPAGRRARATTGPRGTTRRARS